MQTVLQYWLLDDHGKFVSTGYQVNGIPELQHRDAETTTKEDATFVSVACGVGSCSLMTFAVTADGSLCCFGASGKLERLVSLETPVGTALSVTEAYVAAGGASSVVRLFDPTTLEYRATLPFPPAFGQANRPSEQTEIEVYPDKPHCFPAVLAARLSGSHVVVLYSDRSLFIYDVSDLQTMSTERSFLFHCGCIRDLKVAGAVRGVNSRGKLVYDGGLDISSADDAANKVPTGAFITCSDDNTVRVWHLDLHRKPTAPVSRFDPNAAKNSAVDAAWKNPFSQEMLAMIYLDEDHDFEDEHGVVLGGCCSHLNGVDIHSPSKDRGVLTSLRAVAIRPDHSHIAAGDSEGNIMVARMPVGTPVQRIGAHSAEIQTIAFGMTSSGRLPSTEPEFIMATGGRDRLVHLYDCKNDYAVTSTLENHSGAVTGLKFTNDGNKLLSCGADKTVVFSDVSQDGKVARYNSLPFTGGKIFDFAITSDNDTLVAACNNRLDVLTVKTCKQVKTHHVGEQHHIDVSPGNYCVAMSGSLSEKAIHLVDLSTGETIASASGHGEAITSVRFTPDCRRLLSSSNDGCIFVWRLSDDIQSAIKAKLPRVVEPQAVLPAPPVKHEPPQIKHEAPQAKHEAQPAAPMLMPPPPPPPAAMAIPGPKLSAHSVSSAHSDGKTPTRSRNMVPTTGAKMKATGSALNEGSTTRAEEHVIPSEPKLGSEWRGHISAAPGPLSNAPLEDWMRTRESAKKTVSDVESDVTVHQEPTHPDNSDGNAAAITIDRSQTPDWARTAMQPRSVSQAVPTGPDRVSETKANDASQAARGKWGQQAVVQVLSSVDAEVGGGSVSDHYDASSATPGVSNDETLPPSSRNDVLNLSVHDLGISSRSTCQVTTSLALEREQLEKRQKQVDTANAVATMNLKLSQLGLLRPAQNGDRRPSASFQRSESVEPSFSSSANQSAKAGVVSEDSIDYDSSSSSDDSSSDSSADDFTSIKEVASNEAEQKLRPDIPLEMLESIEIPRQKSSAERMIEGKVPQEGAPAVAVAVNESLSVFTRGFAASETGSMVSPHQEPDSLRQQTQPVDCSLSAFSTGYAGGNEALPKPQPSLVAASLSVFTAGYESTSTDATESCETHTTVQLARAEPEDDNRGSNEAQVPTTLPPSVGVDCSVSSFTSGYSNATSSAEPAAKSSKIPLQCETMQSISAFTTGYSSAHAQAQANNTEARRPVGPSIVAASLSTFMMGYEVTASAPQTDQPPALKERSDSTTDGAVMPVETKENPPTTLSKIVEVRPSGSQSDTTFDTQESTLVPTTSGSELQPSDRRDKQVMQSLSSFTSGYEAENPALKESRIGSTPQPSDTQDAAGAYESVHVRSDDIVRQCAHALFVRSASSSSVCTDQTASATIRYSIAVSLHLDSVEAVALISHVNTRMHCQQRAVSAARTRLSSARAIANTTKQAGHEYVRTPEHPLSTAKCNFGWHA